MTVHPYIKISELSKSFLEGSQSREVLHDIELSIEKGEFIALLGASGSGKSTLLNIISGIDSADSGSIIIDNKNLLALDENQFTLFRRNNIGFIFQFFNLLPTLSAIENVMLPLELAGESSTVARDKGMKLLEEVGLASRGESFPDRLSGGEQQRVAIARALIHNPGLILADEPTGNLDEETGLRVMNLLNKLSRAEGKNLIVATHSIENAKLADQIYLLKDGRLETFTF